MNARPAPRTATAPPLAAPPFVPPPLQAATPPEPCDYTGWYVSSLELRQGLSVVDLDDPALHRLFR